MSTPQENASMALAEWQSLKRRYPDPGKRADVFDALMSEFFAPRKPCDVEYEAMMRRIDEEMASDV